VHDISEIERLGVPGVFVASREFEDAAEAQGRALGFDAAFVLVEHPIQDRTDQEMVAIADGAFDALVAQITANP
jgi:hypothetical protein